MVEAVGIQDGVGSAVISLDGGELVRWTVGGRRLTWEPDPSVWAAVSPILFPVVGWSREGRVRIEGRTYPMPVHGFASGQRFDLVGRDDREVVLRLTDSAASIAHYPFRFALTVTYRITGPELSIGLTVENRDARPMPYAIGIHPGFVWPLSGSTRAGHALVFEHDERSSVPVIAPGGLFSAERRSVPLERRVLGLSDALLEREALCFLDVKSHGLDYRAPDGSVLRIDWEGFAHCAIWSRPPASFVSIESWTGHGDPVEFTGELAEKPSMQLLAPGENASHRVRYTFAPALE